MIFYSDKIIEDIIDSNELDEIIDRVDHFKKDIEMIFVYFAYPKISLGYIENLLISDSNKVAFYCMDDTFDIRNCPSCMIYSKQHNKNNNTNSDEIIYYIMMICTQRRFKNMGYATMLLNGFVERVKTESSSKTKIVLSSVDEVVSYYQKYGFEAVDYTLENYPYLMRFEKYDENKMYTIMELYI